MKKPVKSSIASGLDFLTGGGEMGERIRNFDWSKTPLGPPPDWPQSLRSAVSIMLPSKAQIIMFWGAEFTTIYNDAYRPVFGQKHPRVLGLPGREAWDELWLSGLRDLLEGVVATGVAYWATDRAFIVNRHGYAEETYFDVSYDPVRDESGRVGGVFCIVSETTTRVIGARRLKSLRDLSAATTEAAGSIETACGMAASVLEQNRHDLPFTLTYLLDDEGQAARLVAWSGLPSGLPAVPATIDLTAAGTNGSGWPLRDVLVERRAVVVGDLERRMGAAPPGIWAEPTAKAVVHPIPRSGQGSLAGFLITGVSPRRALDDDYLAFLDLLAREVTAMVANARALIDERRRAEALAEIDRAKTVFFSNVSHEFRTPLTLMIGPLEEALANAHGILPLGAAKDLGTSHRNALRLLKLVNTLLEFSRIEAGRIDAHYEATDLADLTSNLVSNFRSACEKAGLRLLVDCWPLRGASPVWVDRDMWEKIVLNLVSNAFKFTLAGQIAVHLDATESHARLRVSDTGVGIPADELPRVFERFHRIRDNRARTHEGTGIGLALVQELVKLHGGTLTVESTIGQGSTFTVSIPLGKAHLDPARVDRGATIPTGMGATAYVEEALRWLPSEDAFGGSPGAPADLPGLATALRGTRDSGGGPRVFWADDNADMRAYVKRLLDAGRRFVVRAFPDGQAALEAARLDPPDVMIADVMMPRLDGFGILREMRADARLRNVPIMLLSARAGEESRVEALDAGADDYMVKPFSARELIARVEALVRIMRLRRDLERDLHARDDRLRAIVDAWPAAMLVNDRDGAIEYQNRGALEILESPEGRDGNLREQIAAITRAGAPVREREVSIGAAGTVAISCTPLKGSGGEILGAIVSLAAKTPRKSPA